MTTYQVVFAVEAQAEAIDAAAHIAREAPATAGQWYVGLERAIRSLESFPNRCPHAPETDFVGEELRHLLYKSHRIIFRVEEQPHIVRVLHVRHAAQRAIGEGGGADEDEEG